MKKKIKEIIFISGLLLVGVGIGGTVYFWGVFSGVKSYPDTESAGWAYKKSDTAFVARKWGCRIQWNAIEPLEENSKKRIGIRGNCSLSFNEQQPLHRAILKKISKRWDIKEFDSVAWTGYNPKLTSPWGSALAIAGTKSDLSLQDGLLNRRLVKIANQHNVYQGFKELFKEFGVDIKLSGVEKVFLFPAKDLPYADELKKNGVSPNTKVLHDAGMCYYEISSRFDKIGLHESP